MAGYMSRGAPNGSVYVCNLPPGTDETMLAEYFGSIGLLKVWVLSGNIFATTTKFAKIPYIFQISFHDKFVSSVVIPHRRTRGLGVQKFGYIGTRLPMNQRVMQRSPMRIHMLLQLRWTGSITKISMGVLSKFT